MEKDIQQLSCLEARRKILTDPRHRDEILVDHLGQCTSCASFFGRQTVIEDQLRRAAEVDVPEGLEARILLAQKLGQKQKQRTNQRWMTLAASVVLAIGIVITAVVLRQPPAIQSYVLEHVRDDHVMLNMDNPMQLVELNAMLSQYGVRVVSDIGDVYYAKDCIVHKKRAAHIVMSGADQLVTVLFMSSENVSKKHEFSDGRYRGVIIPTRHGSIAILSEDLVSVNEAERRIAQATSYDL